MLPGERFGVSETVRTCNLCLELMNEYDDEDDKRSIISNTTTNLHPPAAPAFLTEQTRPTLGGMHVSEYGHSPFAASQLFRHVNQHDTLSAIQETGFRKRNGSSAVESGSDEELSPPGTPLYDRSRLDMLPYGRAKHPLLNVFPNPSSRPSGESAPFRRAMKEEEAKAGGQGTPQSHEIEFNTKLLEDSGAVTKKASNADPVVAVSEAIVHSVKSPRLDGANIKDDPRNLVGLRTATKPVVSSGENVHPPPMSPTSAETALHTAEVPGSLQSRMSSHVPTSVLSGVLLSENTGSNNMWKERSNTVNEDDDLLKPDSLAYFRLMLGQMLTRDKVPKASQWEDTLTTLLLEIAAIARPPVQNAEDIDIRKYVKIKKLPGGTISQSEYIDGTMITKNLEHKRMERHMSSPRILILTFPIDYHRIDNQLISIEPLLAQENSYLQHLSRRITQLRPHLVLAEKNVSRLALDFLMKSKVAVARGVKSSAIHQVARCTQAEVIVSMDRLALEPKLGRCAEFKVQTYEHRLIPGHRKTYLRFEGCQPRLGCTLLLRGSNIENLKIVKRIADFMILVINNLKMETRLFYEEFNIFPPANPSTIRKPKNTQGGSEFVNDPAAFSTFDSMGRFSLNASTRKTRVEEQEMADRLSLEIEHSLQPYINNAISISVATAYPPPAVLEKMHRLDNRLRELRLVRDETEAAQILLEEGHGVSTPRVSEDGHVRELSGDSTGTMSSTSTLREADRRSSKQIQGIEGDFQPRKFALISLDEIRLECDISQTEFEHAEQLKVWRWYIMRNPPDIRPELFQKLRYRSALSYEGLGKFCTEIDTVTTEFYGPKDQTVGQYLETLCANAGKACANKNCSKLRLQHFEVLLHGATRLRIAIEQFPCPTPDSPITWSYCKVCLQTSPTSAVKEGFWNFSWAKYLEHAFYPPGVVGGFHCAHDAYRDQIRYFSIHNFAIRLFNEPLDVYEVIRPTLTLHVKQESPVLLKNAEYEDITTRSVAFFDSVLLRLRTFDFQLVQPDKVNDLREDLYLMSERANADRSTLHESLERTYLQSAATDALALNAVFEALQDRVVQWDTDFQELDKKYLPSEKDIRRLTASHLKRLFAAQDIFSSIDRSVSGRSAVESEITDQKVDHHRDISSNPEVSVQSEVEKPKISLHTDTPIPTLTLDNPEDITSTPLAENPPDLSRRDTITHKIDETQEREYNSDSTISALPQTALVSSMTPTYCNIDSSTSGRETDIPAFISRLPRRSRPAPSVADLVRRFQSSSQLEMTIDSLRLHMSSPSHSRDRDESDSESESHVRPRLKRGKTDGYNSRTRSSSKVATMSDSGGGYAFNASRIPTLIAARRPVLSDIRRNTASDVPYAQAFEDATPNLALGAPRIQGRTRLARTDFAPSALTPESDMNRRRKADVSNVGKGKAPLRNHLLDVNQAEPRPGTPGFKGNSKRVGTGGGNRVSTIARHFDRLSKEAERDRQRRLNQARGRRARPVGITRAKIHVFSNVRDAFRDGESDSASSKADDEEDGEGDSDVSNSAAKEDDIVAASAEARVSASDNSSDDRSEEIAVRPRAESPPSNFEASSVTPSDTATDLSFKDRLQIALPPFDTSTPLLSVPPTPLLTGQKDTLAPSSQVSEAEGNNTIGHERTSILKTLTNLWAFRSGDATMLEYPLSASEHVFADSRVIVRESEPTSIIAFTLASKTYREKLRSVAQMHREQRRTQATTEGSETSLPEDLKSPSLDESKSTLDSVSRQDIADADEGARREGGTHINYGMLRSIRIFYAHL
jgi:1-phosphatidylinositol-3-phosphate 5-kinase